jgi:hypothetical protein
VTVTRQVIVAPPPPGTDTTGPTLSITYPSTTSFATTLTSLRFTGDAFPVVEHVGIDGSRYASFAVSNIGVLVSARGLERPTTQLTWVDRTGRQLGTIGDAAAYQSLALSSNEQRVAVAFATGTPENLDIWLLDVASGAQTRLTFEAASDNAPLWSPDDSRIVFQSTGEDFRHFARNGSTGPRTRSR